MNAISTSAAPLDMPLTRGYQQEMLDDSLRRNIIIALDTGSGKTHIAVLRLRYEMDREPKKVCFHEPCARDVSPQSRIHIDLLVLRPDSGIMRTAEIRPQSTPPCLCWTDIRLQRTKPMEECHPLGRCVTNTPCHGLDSSGFSRCPPSRLHFPGEGYKSYSV